jgi:hypothetical protein
MSRAGDFYPEKWEILKIFFKLNKAEGDCGISGNVVCSLKT